MPDVQHIRQHKRLQFFGTLLHDANLWHLNRRSVSGAMAVGLFMAFVPIPLQMVPAAALAIWLRVNLPISVALVWITNPFTMPPVFYVSYKLGSWILRQPTTELTVPVPDVPFELSWSWLVVEFGKIGAPFLLGSMLIACGAALAGYWGMHAFWRLQVVRDWEKRKKKRGTGKSTKRS